MANINNQHGIRQTVHVFNATQTAFQFFLLTGQRQGFFFTKLGKTAVGSHGFQLLQALDGALDGIEVSEHTTQPAMVHIRHTCSIRMLFNTIAGGTFGTDKQYLAFSGSQFAQEIGGLFIQRQGFFQINDMNFIAFAEDVRSHLGIPETGLVTEMNSGLQHLTHGHLRHVLLLIVWVKPPRIPCTNPGRKTLGPSTLVHVSIRVRI